MTARGAQARQGLDAELAVECRGVWKIFGKRGAEALALMAAKQLGKQEISDRLHCIVGVAGVTFSVQRGEIFCVMGLSGSGKSTLVRHINRLIDPTAGEILVNGQRVDRMNGAELRKLRNETVGMVFQHVALLPHRSVRDNVAFGLEVRGGDTRQRRAAAEAKLDLVQLAGWGDRYPDELSGGMQQRVGLARALAADPDILLMDEPFSALDPLIRRRLQDQFLELSRKLRKTTVFITHDLEEAIKLGDRIGIMRDGKLIQIGTPEQIVGTPADDYVADFVRGMSRLRILRAEHIMQPLRTAHGAPTDAMKPGSPRVQPDARLETLIDLMIRCPAPILVGADGSEPSGVVTVQALLQAIRGMDSPPEPGP
jgi:glycine betaine/proline transport system ATP-binding protein